MPIVIWVAGGSPEEVSLQSGIVIALGGLALTGAAVDAVHGGFLLWLLFSRRLLRDSVQSL